VRAAGRGGGRRQRKAPSWCLCPSLAPRGGSVVKKKRINASSKPTVGKPRASAVCSETGDGWDAAKLTRGRDAKGPAPAAKGFCHLAAHDESQRSAGVQR
jgi:hypothetical protein